MSKKIVNNKISLTYLVLTVTEKYLSNMFSYYRILTQSLVGQNQRKNADNYRDNNSHKHLSYVDRDPIVFDFQR